jgi:hypothetical protein
MSEDGIVSVRGNITITDKTIEKLPVKFSEVTGVFKCKGCSLLSSIEGVPHHALSYEFEDCLFPSDFYTLAIKEHLSLEEYINVHFNEMELNEENLKIIEQYFPAVYEHHRGIIVGAKFGF